MKQWWILCFLGLCLGLSACNSQSGPRHWEGVGAKVIQSSDNAHCGKSSAAKRMNVPGFIVVDWNEWSGIYHSTDRIAALPADAVHTGYRLGDLTLWKLPTSDKEIYVQSGSGKGLVYELGGCV